jgi:hypothetical protein
MPEPTTEELKKNDRDGFVSRCIAYVENEDTGQSKDSIIAMCFSKWRSAKDKQE